MKNKIKTTLFVVSITFIMLFLLIEVINIFTFNDKVYLEDKEDNLTRLYEYKNRLSTLEDGSCKTSLEKYVKRYEDTSFKGYVSLKSIYNRLDSYSSSIPKSYQDIKTSCSITNEEVEEYGLIYYILDSMITYEEFFVGRRYPYEIGIQDKLIRDIAEPSLDLYRYDKIKRSELSFIENVLDLLEVREKNYEG